LSTREYLVGNHFSIADIANFAVVDVGRTSGVDRARFEHVDRWWKTIAARPATQTGSMIPFPNPMLGRTYMQRWMEEPGFKEQEDAVFKTIEDAKVKYGYLYSSP
jgi:glutathione S-transferase